MKLGRRNFFTLSTLAIAGLVALKGKVWPQREWKIKKTAQFLSHNGRLVEIDLDKVPFTRKRVSKNQLVAWVWKEQKL